jgi:hyperosmotically inducible periplasmic protein
MLNRSIIFVSTALLAFSLVGCSGGSSLPAAAVVSDKPSIYKVNQDLKARLAKDDRLQGSNITFDFDGSTVILNGKVKDQEQFGWAATVAAGTAGVNSVINRLQIEAQEAKPEKAVEKNKEAPAKLVAPKKQIPKTQPVQPEA